MTSPFIISYFFFFNDTATTEIYTLSLHDALPIYMAIHSITASNDSAAVGLIKFILGTHAKVVARLHDYDTWPCHYLGDRKSTRLNSSHGYISYAVFCLKKKKQNINASDQYSN